MSLQHVQATDAGVSSGQSAQVPAVREVVGDYLMISSNGPGSNHSTYSGFPPPANTLASFWNFCSSAWEPNPLSTTQGKCSEACCQHSSLSHVQHFGFLDAPWTPDSSSGTAAP